MHWFLDHLGEQVSITWRPPSREDVTVSGRLYGVDQKLISIGAVSISLSDEAFILNVEPEPAACDDCLDERIESLQKHLGKLPKPSPSRPFLG